MTKSIFVTATGTDIGKTYISALLLKKMREYGYRCGYFKPVLSGAVREGTTLIPGDCKYVIEFANLNTEPMECLSYCFEEAVSPHLAAERTSVVIDETKIISDYNSFASNYDYMIIEGAGGITCPLVLNDKKTYLMSNLIKDMNQSVLIVADGGLGTINSVLLTIEYAKTRNINVAGIILNNFDKNNFMHVDNLEQIEKLTGQKVIATVAKYDKDLSISQSCLEQIFS